MLLGGAVALSILSDQSNNYAREDFEGFVITKLDGTTVKVWSSPSISAVRLVRNLRRGGE
jgi:hypothetical protein